MAGKVLLNLTEITSTIDDDLLYVVRGVGADRDKKIKIQNLVGTVLSATGTASVDLSAYGGDLTIVCSGSSGYTITLSNYLQPGKTLSVVNLATSNIALAGPITRTVYVGEAISFKSSGSALKLIQPFVFSAKQINDPGSDGIDIDGVTIKDGIVETDEINEKTGGAGVTVDGVLLKDGEVECDEVRTNTISKKTDAGVVINDNSIRYASESSVTGSTIRAALASAGFLASGVRYSCHGGFIDTDDVTRHRILIPCEIIITGSTIKITCIRFEPGGATSPLVPDAKIDLDITSLTFTDVAITVQKNVSIIA